MQSEAEAVRAAESCVLGAAERHMEGGAVERRCIDCEYFTEIGGTLGLSAGLERSLSYCGV